MLHIMLKLILDKKLCRIQMSLIGALRWSKRCTAGQGKVTLPTFDRLTRTYERCSIKDVSVH